MMPPRKVGGKKSTKSKKVKKKGRQVAPPSSLLSLSRAPEESGSEEEEEEEDALRDLAAMGRRGTVMERDEAGKKARRAMRLEKLEKISPRAGGRSGMSGGSSAKLPPIGTSSTAASAEAAIEAAAQAELDAKINAIVQAKLNAERGVSKAAEPDWMQDISAASASSRARLMSPTARAPRVRSDMLSHEERAELDLGHVSAEEEFDFHEIFDIIDLDHGGTIDTYELEELLDLLNVDHTPAEVASLMEVAGTDEDGDIPFKNFLRAVTCKPNRRYNKRMVLDAFKVFEVDGFTGWV